MTESQEISTGYKKLDLAIKGLKGGDNVVFKVESVNDYLFFVAPFVDQVRQADTVVNYIRFGEHPSLLEEAPSVNIHELDPRIGFEFFTRSIYNIVTEQGPGAFYVFDCLTDLVSAWATDHMISNFFEVTCPLLSELGGVAYFSLIRDRHSFAMNERIRSKTQVLIDSFNHDSNFYIQPLKVRQCHSPTMFLPHQYAEDHFVPLTNSIDTTRLYSSLAKRTRNADQRQVDHWHRMFIAASRVDKGPTSDRARIDVTRELCQYVIAREDPMLSLAERYFNLEDLLEIKARMVGTGFIGGKAVGMLLAHNILRQDRSFDWSNHLEPHDSHYIGSHVYYSYIIYNDLWSLYMRQKLDEHYYSAAAELREKMMHGQFPPIVREGFRKLLDYFGTYPIIIRSSSLLEDSFGNAFAGKYESFFCVNQGSPEERLEKLEEVIRKIYASTMGEDALSYRLQRFLDQQDEQMALLVQRVSGAYHNQYYLPELAGVGVSYNTFVWDSKMDPQAGMLRLVVGLGTRAVGRSDGDYPRVVALDAPEMRQHSGLEDVRKFSQRDIDLLNISENRLESVSLTRLVAEKVAIPWHLYAIRDNETMRMLEQRGRKVDDIWLLTFDEFLQQTDFTALMQRLLKTLEHAYQHPVDVEFTVNFTADRTAKIDVVQCRPLQTKGLREQVEIPEKIARDRLFFRSSGHFMGGNLAEMIDWVIWVDATEYLHLSQPDRYEVSRMVGELNRIIGARKDNRIMLLGPGRWGTSTPSLGVPISFARINNLTALVEVAFPAGNLMPELSYGSHFFQDLIEADIFYLALFPDSQECDFNEAWLQRQENSLALLNEEYAYFSRVIKVVQVPTPGLKLIADVVSQELLCFEPE